MRWYLYHQLLNLLLNVNVWVIGASEWAGDNFAMLQIQNSAVYL